MYRPSQISQKKSNFIVVYVAKRMHHLSTVEQKEFINLIQELSPQKSVISKRTQERRNDDKFASKVNGLKEILKSVKNACIIADVWSFSVSSFIAVTAHWIKPDTLERQSAALACCHFLSPHTNNRIAEILDEIHSVYGLSHEYIVATVTYNGANFVKAFKEFSVCG